LQSKRWRKTQLICSFNTHHLFVVMVLFTNEYLMEVGHDAEWLMKENNLSSLSRGIVTCAALRKKIVVNSVILFTHTSMYEKQHQWESSCFHPIYAY
jgi:hypothetical protein